MLYVIVGFCLPIALAVMSFGMLKSSELPTARLNSLILGASGLELAGGALVLATTFLALVRQLRAGQVGFVALLAAVGAGMIVAALIQIVVFPSVLPRRDV